MSRSTRRIPDTTTWAALQPALRLLKQVIAPSVVQGLVSCAKCSYALSRTSTQTTARKLHYYKCIGSDSWRKRGGPVCDSGRLIRQELLDQIVWAEVIRRLEEPALIHQELDRRLAAARTSDPTAKREESLPSELTHVGKVSNVHTLTQLLKRQEFFRIGGEKSRYKLIHYYEPPEEFGLYDLQEDPGELHNLYGEPQHTGLARELLNRIAELRRKTGDIGRPRDMSGAKTFSCEETMTA